MNNINTLITNINKSNLSDADKKQLLTALEGAGSNWQNFLIQFYEVFSISKEILDQFDVDIGEVIKNMLEK